MKYNGKIMFKRASKNTSDGYRKDSKPKEGKMFTSKAQKQWATLKIYINIVLLRISTIKIIKKGGKRKARQ